MQNLRFDEAYWLNLRFRGCSEGLSGAANRGVECVPTPPKRKLKSSPGRWLPWSSWDGLSCWPPHFYPRDKPRPRTGAVSFESLLLFFAPLGPSHRLPHHASGRLVRVGHKIVDNQQPEHNQDGCADAEQDPGTGSGYRPQKQDAEDIGDNLAAAFDAVHFSRKVRHANFSAIAASRYSRWRMEPTAPRRTMA